MIYTIKLRGGVFTPSRIDDNEQAIAEDGLFGLDITGEIQVEALTRKAAEDIALARANELLSINDSGEGVEFEIVREVSPRVQLAKPKRVTGAKRKCESSPWEPKKHDLRRS